MQRPALHFTFVPLGPKLSMFNNGKPQQDILPGANPEEDCQTSDAMGQGDPIDHDHDHDVSWRDVQTVEALGTGTIADWLPQRGGWAIGLERVALAVERPANRLIGAPQLNPFYHTGTIATLLLVIVALTGFFLFLFYQYGFDASYNAVLTRIETPIIARTIRAIHRYASGALVITTLLHAYRTLFMERFRGPRWLAWVTGIVMTGLLWFAGVTGYWLIWDQRAQVINDAFVQFLETVTPFAAPYMVAFTEAARSEVSWPIFLSILAVHIVLFLVVAGFYWLHIKHLQRPKWLPPPFWVVGIGIVVVAVAAIFPAGMLPQGDLTRLPEPMTIDPFFLFYLPFRGNAVLNSVLWGGLMAVGILFALLPWLGRKRQANMTEAVTPATAPTVKIIKDRCSGCTVCALDCPYGAIEMVERTDGKPHKYIAIEDPALCVSCGICVGSCDGVAVTMGQRPPSLLWDTVSTRLALAKLQRPLGEVRVIYTCERHAQHGGRAYVEQPDRQENGYAITVIELPCVGTAPPDLLARTLDEGVANVHVIGCPPDDCANREGNLWLEQRITRERVPRLKRPYANAPITASWLPPDDFAVGVAAIPEHPARSNYVEPEQPDYMSLRELFQPLTWRNYVVAFVLLALVMVGQVLLTDVPFAPYAKLDAAGQIIVPDLAAPIGRSSYIASTLGPTLELRLEVDQEVMLQEVWATSAILVSDSFPYYARFELTAGDHDLRLYLVDPASGTTIVLAEQSGLIETREIVTLPVSIGP